ncbi:MAG: hypothetical protein QHH06_10595 [Clostridiales bacterium]|nr:hypothetical protein [Eubacteriales bacterium]MDH7566914.1 hypothetical protein [Clostridiales bacterium]
MDENFSNTPDNNQEGLKSNDPENSERNRNNTVSFNNMSKPDPNHTDVHRFTLDNSGNIRTGSSGTASIATGSRTYIIIGWICAAFTLLWSPYFAIPGVILGVLANRSVRSSGNTVIATNIVFAALNILFALVFGVFVLGILRRVIIGY